MSLDIKNRVHVFRNLFNSNLERFFITPTLYDEFLKQVKKDVALSDKGAYQIRSDLGIFLAENLAEPLFDHIQNFADLIAIYILYIRGEIPSSPNYGGPLDLETGILVKKLVKMIGKYQCISLDSQPGICNEYVRQRGYIELLMERSNPNLPKFMKSIQNDEHLACTIQFQNNSQLNFSNILDRFKNAKYDKPQGKLEYNYNDEIRYDHPPDDQTLVASNQGSDKVMLPATAIFEDGGWYMHAKTHYRPYFSKNPFDWLEEKFNFQNLVYIYILMIPFCDTSLLDIVLKYFELNEQE